MSLIFSKLGDEVNSHAIYSTELVSRTVIRFSLSKYYEMNLKIYKGQLARSHTYEYLPAHTHTYHRPH